MKQIYLDNAAATPINPRVLKVMNSASRKYGNPSSYNDTGRLARGEMNSARLVIASFLSARPEEIVFTSSGSEANNLAIFGVTKMVRESKIKNFKPHIITTKIEHPSVLEPIKQLEKEGFDVTYLPVNKEGFVNLDEFRNVLRAETVLVSVMYANNEIGTIQPIRQISKIIRDFKTVNSKLETGNLPLFHVDACQATGFLDMNVQHLGADLLTFNGSKIYGPRGIGVLYIRRSVKIRPLIFGGSQERGLRAGTENVPTIVGLAKAVSIIKPSELEKLSTLRDYAIEQLENKISGVLVNGPRGAERLANNINICIPNLESENLLLELDKYGISAGSGSACTSHAVEPSHVLKAIGVSSGYINGALRFSLGRETTKKDIDYLIRSLVKIIADLNKRYARLR